MRDSFFSFWKLALGAAIILIAAISCKHASQSSVEALQSEMSSLVASVQSVVVVPDYEDGSVKMTDGVSNVLRFEVYPLAAAQRLVTALGPSAFSLDCVQTETKSSPLINIPVRSVAFDGTFVSVVADGSGLQEQITSGISPANARLRITDGKVTRSSEYFALTYRTSSGEPVPNGNSVTVGTEKLSAVSVVLKGKALINDTDRDAEYGFVYATSALAMAENPTTVIADNIDADAIYSIALSGQTPNTTYYFRSILFKNGTLYYGETKSFTTKEVSSLSETLEASDLGSVSATLNAKLDLTDVLYESLEYGFYWGTSETSQPTYIKCENLAEQAYSASLSGLSHNTRYWYKSCVKIDSQTFYGEVKSFSTGVVPVESVSLKPTLVVHAIDSTWTLEPVITPANATNKAVTWESSDASVVTIDASGRATARSNGTATLTVTTVDQSKTATCLVTVSQWVTELTLDKSSVTLNEGQTTTVSVTNVAPANAVDKTYTWSSSDTSVATVDSDSGLITAVSKGTAGIIATAKDGSGTIATCMVVVNKLVSSIAFTPASYSVYNGKTVALSATVLPEAASNKSLSWESSNTAVAKVSASGVVTGVSKGTVTITATAKDGSGVSGTCEVEVKQYVTSLTLDKTSFSLEEGQTATISVSTVAPDNANDKSVSWSSGDPSVATVNAQSGVVTAVSGGPVTIVATANDGSGVSSSCEVYVMGAVDLGLSVKWRGSNLGASNPEDAGNYYAWGETETKSDYSWSKYKFGTSQSGPFSAYNSTDGKTLLDAADDVARTLGSAWRMPTIAEWEELLNEDNCDWEWTTLGGANGYKVTSKKAGHTSKWIFLPAAGYKMGSNLKDNGSFGYYWSSSLSADHIYTASYLGFYELAASKANSNRCNGQSVRPVLPNE